MTKLIVIRGNSGSGKTTLAKKLQVALGRDTMLLSQDVIRREMMRTPDGPDTLIIPLIIEMVRYGRTVCPHIIVEGIFNQDWYAEMFDQLVVLCERNVLAYYFDLPFEETLRRHQMRDKIHEFGEEEMRRWWNEKDYIGSLNEQTLTADHRIEYIVEKIINDIKLLNKKPEKSAEI